MGKLGEAMILNVSGVTSSPCTTAQTAMKLSSRLQDYLPTGHGNTMTHLLWCWSVIGAVMNLRNINLKLITMKDTVSQGSALDYVMTSGSLITRLVKDQKHKSTLVSGAERVLWISRPGGRGTNIPSASGAAWRIGGRIREMIVGMVGTQVACGVRSGKRSVREMEYAKNVVAEKGLSMFITSLPSTSLRMKKKLIIWIILSFSAGSAIPISSGGILSFLKMRWSAI